MKAESEQVHKQIDGDTSMIVSSHVVSILPAYMSASFRPWNLAHIPSTGRPDTSESNVEKVIGCDT